MQKCSGLGHRQVKFSVDPLVPNLLHSMQLQHTTGSSAPATSPISPPLEVPAQPYLQLDSPGLIDDFYFHLLSWSAGHILAMGLGSAVYFGNAQTHAVECQVDFGDHNSIASVKWYPSHGCMHNVAVGTNSNALVVDALTKQQVYSSMA